MFRIIVGVLLLLWLNSGYLVLDTAGDLTLNNEPIKNLTYDHEKDVFLNLTEQFESDSCLNDAVLESVNIIFAIIVAIYYNINKGAAQKWKILTLAITMNCYIFFINLISNAAGFSQKWSFYGFTVFTACSTLAICIKFVRAVPANHQYATYFTIWVSWLLMFVLALFNYLIDYHVSQLQCVGKFRPFIALICTFGGFLITVMSCFYNWSDKKEITVSLEEFLKHINNGTFPIFYDSNRGYAYIKIQTDQRYQLSKNRNGQYYLKKNNQ